MKANLYKNTNPNTNPNINPSLTNTIPSYILIPILIIIFIARGTQNTWDKLLTYTYSWMASDGHIKEMGSWERTKKSRFYIYNETEITFCLRKSERFEMVA